MEVRRAQFSLWKFKMKENKNAKRLSSRNSFSDTYFIYTYSHILLGLFLVATAFFWWTNLLYTQAELVRKATRTIHHIKVHYLTIIKWIRLSILWIIMEIEEGVIQPRRITPSEISIILHMVRKSSSIIVLLFIQNNS